ncbi:MAG TPA: homoserine O-acetyltransferase [Acidimicrobiia bacterium]|nr:homoserine O-acetyltransferase [Acidimicrobiia bacterium]
MKHIVTVGPVFPLEGGGTLSDVRVEVRSWGRHRRNASLVCHALTGSADADHWWGGLFGSSRVLDPATSFVVSMNVLGGCNGTTGPTTIDPGRGVPYGPDFPAVTIRDMVRLQHMVLERMGVDHLDLAIGGSMGAMQVLEWIAMYPEFVSNAVAIAVGSEQSAWAIALSDAQRHAITTDRHFLAGRYEPTKPPVDGLATARMIAMASYRSPTGFSGRFGRRQHNGRFEVQSYLRHQGARLVERFDANTYLTLIDAMDSHDLGRGRGPAEAILRRIATRTLVVGISTDVLYPVAEVRQVAEALPNSRFAVLDSPHGHDAFLIDTDQLATIVRGFLDDVDPEVDLMGRGASWA